MDVLWLPMVEGFVPPSAACMRAEMARVVQGYTLKSEDMLVHCQGELSRAGVVAGCWQLRLGVPGSFPEAEERGSRTGRARQTQGRRACARSRRRLVCSGGGGVSKPSRRRNRSCLSSRTTLTYLARLRVERLGIASAHGIGSKQVRDEAPSLVSEGRKVELQATRLRVESRGFESHWRRMSVWPHRVMSWP
jgi:hypothetical protein